MSVVLVSATAHAADKPAKKMSKAEMIKRGEHIVKIASCNDCHTPAKMGPTGPEPDMDRMLSGHPQDMKLPPPPQLGMPWAVAGAISFTAWSGPWGVSFTRNLTPDKETGLGDWTEQNFIDTIRTGKRLGKGRPLLPPMPVRWVNEMTDEDLKCVFAYLQSIPAVKNQVPEPLPPSAPPAAAGMAKTTP
jgi:hypothetical protein